MSIKIAIAGYGNLGRGVECSVAQNEDLELFGVFSRRDPASVTTLTGAEVYPMDDILKYKNDIDVVIICGGSATDLPVQTPALAQHFNVVDSFDTHANIPVHFENVDKCAQESGKIAVISAGWDPGLFSIARVYAESVLTEGATYTFWGKGVSQGHSDAIRRIEGVADARQYTIPVDVALEKVRGGKNPVLTTREKHIRECFVVVKEGYDKAKIEQEIVTMPNYFADYDTIVHFISAEEMTRDHSSLPHGGFVIRSGVTGLNKEHNNIIEYSLKLDSNPEFTSSVLTACARAAYRMNAEGMKGAKTVFDIAPAYLSQKSPAQLRKELL